MSTITLAHLLGNQTQTNTLAFTDTKTLTVYTISAAPLSHVWYQVWNHGVQVAQTSSLAEAVNAYNVAECEPCGARLWARLLMSSCRPLANNLAERRVR